MMNYTYKIAQLTDIPIVVSLADRIWKQTYREIITEEQIEYMYSRMYSVEALKEQFTNGHTFIIVYQGNEALGFAGFSETEEKVVKIHKLYVLPETQGKGIGRFLINAIKDLVKPNGIEIIELNVNRYNKAKSFYEKLGFSIYEVVDIPYGKFFLNDYVMRLNI